MIYYFLGGDIIKIRALPAGKFALTVYSRTEDMMRLSICQPKVQKKGCEKFSEYFDVR